MRTLSFMVALTFFFMVLMAGQAFAFGEAFEGVISGTEYCGDFNYKNAKRILWIKMLSQTEMIVSFTPDFEAGTTFTMHGAAYQINKTKAAFVVGAFFEDGSFATIQGTASLDGSGNVKKLKGTFIQDGVIDSDCFSAGNFRTTVRLLH